MWGLLLLLAQTRDRARHLKPLKRTQQVVQSALEHLEKGKRKRSPDDKPKLASGVTEFDMGLLSLIAQARARLPVLPLAVGVRADQEPAHQPGRDHAQLIIHLDQVLSRKRGVWRLRTRDWRLRGQQLRNQALVRRQPRSFRLQG